MLGSDVAARDHSQQLDHKFEHGSARHARHCLVTISEMRTKPDSTHFTNPHPLGAVIKPGHNTAPPNLERGLLFRLHYIASIQRHRVHNFDHGPALRERAASEK